MHQEEKPGISIIVLNHNGAHHLKRLFSTFKDNNSYQPYEFIIVDHASNDHTDEVVERCSKEIPVVYLKREKNYSFSASNNFAAQKAKYPYLLFMNNDIIYTNDVLPLAAAQLQDEKIGAVGIRLDDDPYSLPPGKEPSVQHVGIKFAWDQKYSFYRPYQVRLKSINEANKVPNGIYLAVTGAFMLCRKSDFEKIGGFCEEYDYGLEDVDFCLQLKSKLVKSCLCINELSLQHVEGAARKIAKGRIKKSRYTNNDSVFKSRFGNEIKELIMDHLIRVKERPMSVLQKETVKLLDGKVAVVCHVYYLKHWKEIAEKIKNIPLNYRLFATITDENSSFVRAAILDEFPDAEIREFPNIGKDTAPFIKLLPEIISGGYEIVCKVHTKKDDPRLGNTWRELMLSCTLGTSNLVALILNRFAEDPYLGMVGPSLLYKSNNAHIFDNRENINMIWQMMNSNNALPDNWGFFAGSCFWARTEPLKHFADVANKIEFEKENNKDDGQIAHALERLFGLCIMKAGYVFGLIDNEPDTVYNKIFTRVISPGKPSNESVKKTFSKTKIINAKYGSSYKCQHDYNFNTFDEYLCEAMLDLELIKAPLNEQALRVIGYMDCLKNKMVDKYSRNEQTDLVSVIMPTYNRAHVILDAIASVQKQAYKNWELVVIDDCSIDNTAEVIETINDERIRVLKRKKNGGASLARNDGLNIAKGEWIAYLDTDDLWDPNFLLIMINELKNNLEFKSAYSAQFVWKSVPKLDPSGEFSREESKLRCLRFGPYNRSLLENRNGINTNSFVHHRSLYEKHGGWPESMRRFVDWNLVLRYTADLPPLAIPVLLSHNIEDKDENRITLREGKTLAYKGIDRLLFSKNLFDTFSNQLTFDKVKVFAPINALREANYRRGATIVIPSYETVDCLRVCIESIYKFSNNIEVVVVDNCSSSKVRNYLKTLEDKGQIKLILNKANYGFSCAVNQGIMEAKQENDIVLMNNDAMVTPGWLDALREVVENVTDLGIAVPRQMLLPREKTINIHLPRWAIENREADVSLSAHHQNILNPLFDQVRSFVELKFAPFFCVYLPRETIDEAGILDEKNGPHYRSDRLYCDIIRNVYNRRIIYTPYSKVYHFHQRATKELKIKNPEMYKVMFEKNDWKSINYLAKLKQTFDSRQQEGKYSKTILSTFINKRLRIWSD